MGSDGSTGDIGSVVTRRVMCYSCIWSHAGWAWSALRGPRTLVVMVRARSLGRMRGCVGAVGVRGPGAGGPAASWGTLGPSFPELTSSSCFSLSRGTEVPLGSLALRVPVATRASGLQALL